MLLVRISQTCSVHYPFIMWQHSVRVFTSMRAMAHFSINYLNVLLECMLLLYAHVLLESIDMILAHYVICLLIMLL